MTHARKNIRDALPRCAPGQEHYEAAQSAGWYCTANDRDDVDAILAGMNLLTIARTALLEGQTLEDAGKCGPYGTAAQQRAWAAGQLAAACHAIVHAKDLIEERARWANMAAHHRREVTALQTEVRAAWKAAKIEVPFRAPRPRGGTPEWAA